MGFSGTTIKTKISHSMNNMLMLHASCQGIIQAYIEPSDSSWYTVLLGELGDAENLVVDWRQNGCLYFQQNILKQSITCGQDFLNSKSNIDRLYTLLESNYSKELQQKIINELQTLCNPIQDLSIQINGYLTKLKGFEINMQSVETKMNNTIGKIQKEEAHIKADIIRINTLVDELKKQIIIDRKTIAKAKKAEKKGIWETIFGFLLAPVTGGLSLILAGIGVSSIAEAESHITDLKNTISKYGKEIIGSQGSLSKDLLQVSTLHGLLMSVSITMSDIAQIGNSLDDLKINWMTLNGELTNTISEVAKAKDTKQAMVGKLWFDAACNQWEEIVSHNSNLSNRTISTTHIQV